MSGRRVTLVGLDFGTTTSSAAVATAVIGCNARTGRTELNRVELVSQSDPVFTPFVNDTLDEARLNEHMASWFAGVDRNDIFGGGALVTGLAAQRANAPLFARQTRRYLQDAVVAVASDPRLESWMAFMGNCADLSRANPGRPFVNVDIGGGTSNVALGRNGEVEATGSYFVGARHIAVAPGGYRVTAVSPYARQLLSHLRIDKGVGDELTDREVLAVLDWYLDLLLSVITPVAQKLDGPVAGHQQAAFAMPPVDTPPAVTISGGVGQLVYKCLHGAALPPTTAYGDLGIDMAVRMAESPAWRHLLTEFTPKALGRATLYGLLRYGTQVSGNTLFLGEATALPLDDLVIAGTVEPASSAEHIDRLLALAATAVNGACINVRWPALNPPVRALALRLRGHVARFAAFETVPLVFLMKPNLGKVFGQYLTDWGRAPFRVVVVDQVEPRHVQFAQIGRPRDGVVPVSFFGMNLTEELP